MRLFPLLRALALASPALAEDDDAPAGLLAGPNKHSLPEVMLSPLVARLAAGMPNTTR